MKTLHTLSLLAAIFIATSAADTIGAPGNPVKTGNSIAPAHQPVISWDILARHGIHPAAGLRVVALRGFFRPNQPEVRNRYDDLLVVVHENKILAACRGNTLPSSHGYNAHPGVRKYYPVLRPGNYTLRVGNYTSFSGVNRDCLRQHSSMTVTRDNGITESGHFGLHLHIGALASTSSFACQTVYPQDWAALWACFANKEGTLVPYLLMDVRGH